MLFIQLRNGTPLLFVSPYLEVRRFLINNMIIEDSVAKWPKSGPRLSLLFDIMRPGLGRVRWINVDESFMTQRCFGIRIKKFNGVWNVSRRQLLAVDSTFFLENVGKTILAFTTKVCGGLCFGFKFNWLSHRRPIKTVPSFTLK